MGILILIAVGGTLGWLSSILLRREASEEIVRNIAVGIIGALLGGTLASSVSVLSGLSTAGLLVGMVCTGIAIAVFNLLRGGTIAGSIHE